MTFHVHDKSKGNGSLSMRLVTEDDGIFFNRVFGTVTDDKAAIEIQDYRQSTARFSAQNQHHTMGQ